MVPEHEQGPALAAVDPERVQCRVIAAPEPCHRLSAGELVCEQGEGVRGWVAAPETAVAIAEQRELADQQVHHLVVVDRPGVFGCEVPVRGSVDAAGLCQQGALDHLAARDAVPLGLQFGRAPGHEHLQRGRQIVHPGVQGGHGPAFRGLLSRLCRELGGALRLRRLGERGREHLLHDRGGVGELEGLRTGMLTHDEGLEIPVCPHELPGGVQVVRHVGGVTVQVHAEQVEGAAPGRGEVIEEPPWCTVRFAAEHVVATATEHDRRAGVGVLDRAEEGLELRHVFGGRAGPQQAGIARLVVALPVLHPPSAAAHHLAHEFAVRALVEGR